MLYNQRLGDGVKFINRDGSETADKGDGVHLTDKRVGVIFEADGDVAEIIIIPPLFNDGMAFRQFVGNQIEGMDTYGQSLKATFST